MSPGKRFITPGIGLIVIGLYLCYGGRFDWQGKLPGGIRIERESFRLYVPPGTCVLISATASLLPWRLSR